ncbi:MAG: hypothetical protein AUG17_07215 [Crenarchaeota archaeon 13_1_20CM_2_53_14]|nr:MAG: hypothetical protein AUI07_08745 [archaeon 13_2_20CM_2_53_6]OLE58582.1 MAG: hypothetical protein AUG17_07215 [Crenarchaeota archaeon 13_1_20CM_2_53_14]
MLVEAGIIAFLGYWLMSEYVYDVSFHSYVDQALLSHVTWYTAILGLGIGMGCSAAAVACYKILRNARHGLETTHAPRFRGRFGKLSTGLPVSGARSSSSVAIEPKASDAPAPSTSSTLTAIVPVPEKSESKKDAS